MCSTENEPSDMTHSEKVFFPAGCRTMSGRLLFFILVVSSFSSCASQVGPIIDPNLIVSILWYSGEAGTVDDEKARKLLVTAAADGDSLSTMWIARVYSTGRMGYPVDKLHAQALATLVIADVEALAAAGVGEAQFLMGTAFAEALGRTRDDRLAAEWYLRAAEAGHVLAAHNMGNIHFSGTGVVQDDALAVRWWMQAAQAGDAIPQFRLGEMYEHGRGVEENLESAKLWYRESARRGNSNARDALKRIGD